MHNFVKMFGCEYRDGRSAAVPLLRPMEESNLLDSPLGGRGHKDIVSNIFSRVDLACCELPVPVFSLRSSDRLPHLSPAADLDRLPPRYEAPEDDVFVIGDVDYEARQAGCSSGSNILGTSRNSR